MKLFKKLGLALALGTSLVLVACGGDNPNEGSSASNTPTCTVVSNWNKMSTGLTESKVLSILGNPAQVSSDGKVTTYKYEDCRIFKVVKTEATATAKAVYETITIGGTVVFSPTRNGYVASFVSPGVPTQAYSEVYNYLGG